MRVASSFQITKCLMGSLLLDLLKCDRWSVTGGNYLEVMSSKQGNKKRRKKFTAENAFIGERFQTLTHLLLVYFKSLFLRWENGLSTENCEKEEMVQEFHQSFLPWASPSFYSNLNIIILTSRPVSWDGFCIFSPKTEQREDITSRKGSVICCA